MENVISSPLLYNLALTLIHFLWQGCLIAFALKFLLILTPHRKSQTRYALSAIAMLSCLIVPLFTYFIIYQPSYLDVSAYESKVSFIGNTASLISQENSSWYQEFFDALPFVSIFWITTVSILASKLAIELYNVNQLPKVGTVAADDKLQQRFHHLVKQINLKKTPQLLISLKTDIPMAIGWLKPVILIPASMLTGLTPAQLDMLILHELAHIRRHDYLVNFFQTLVETLLFFHPAVRWISKQMRNEREYCSDDIAVKVSGNPIAYAHTLADTASICMKHRNHAIPTMAMAASGGDLKQRVVRLVDQHHCSSNDDSGKFLASVLIIFSILTVAIKPYLNASIIDFTSGRISLFKTAGEIIQQQPASAVNLSSTSIAQLLLTQDKKSIQASPVNHELDNIEKTPVEADKKEINNTHKANATINKVNLVAESTTTEEAVLKQEPITTTVNTSVAASMTHSPKSSAESLLTTTQEKSISELAFERTDSTNKASSMNNPYSSQVASLVNEPITDNNHKAFNTIQADSKAQKKPKPLYTISPVKKTVVKSAPAKKRAAEILTSPDPKYPSTATRKGIEIDVTVNFIIDKDGLVKDIAFEQKSKVSYFRSAIRTAMSKWRFLPAQRNGQPVESKMTKIFSFSLTK